MRYTGAMPSLSTECLVCQVWAALKTAVISQPSSDVLEPAYLRTFHVRQVFPITQLNQDFLMFQDSLTDILPDLTEASE